MTETASIEELSDNFNRTQAEMIGSMAELYNMTNQMSENDPSSLQDKLTIYGNIYEIMGDMEAFTVGQKELAYAYRKEKEAHVYLFKRKDDDGNKLTLKEREKVAELSVKKYRRMEAKYTEESKKWFNRRQAVLEQINIMKKKQDAFKEMYARANTVNS